MTVLKRDKLTWGLSRGDQTRTDSVQNDHAQLSKSVNTVSMSSFLQGEGKAHVKQRSGYNMLTVHDIVYKQRIVLL